MNRGIGQPKQESKVKVVGQKYRSHESFLKVMHKRHAAFNFYTALFVITKKFMYAGCSHRKFNYRLG